MSWLHGGDDATLADALRATSSPPAPSTPSCTARRAPSAPSAATCSPSAGFRASPSRSPATGSSTRTEEGWRKDKPAWNRLVEADLAGAALGGRRPTRRIRADQRGSHQFQRPISEITAGTISARMIVASMRIPAASADGHHLHVGLRPEAIEMKVRNRISAALVTSRPVRPMPWITAVSVEPVRSYSSRMRERMKTS